jgi:hypothetical protein
MRSSLARLELSRLRLPDEIPIHGLIDHLESQNYRSCRQSEFQTVKLCEPDDRSRAGEDESTYSST